VADRPAAFALHHARPCVTMIRSDWLARPAQGRQARRRPAWPALPPDARTASRSRVPCAAGRA